MKNQAGDNAEKRIKRALVELLLKSNLDKVTVTEICKKAHVNRSTFYAHFLDTADLYAQFENDVVTEITDIILAENSPHIDYRVYLQLVMRYVASHSNEYLSLMRANPDFFKHFCLNHAHFYRNHCNANSDLDSYLEDYSISGTFNVITQWLQNGKKESIETMVDMLYTFNSNYAN